MRPSAVTVRAPAAALLLGLAAALLAGSLAGCSEETTAPGDAFAPAGEPRMVGPWTEIYPPATTADLRAVWALDADDAWAAGTGGTVLRVRGSDVTVHALDTSSDVVAIAGRGRQDVWVLASDRHLWHWDGTGWTARTVPSDQIAHDASLVVTPSGVVWVATTERRVVPGAGPADDPVYGWAAVILRLAHGQWRQWTLHTRPDGWLELHLWEVHPDGPLVATAAGDSLTAHTFTGDAWQALDWPLAAVLAHDGPVLVGRQRQPPVRDNVYQIQDDLSLQVRCEGASADMICRSRTLVLGNRSALFGLTDCQRFRVRDGFRDDLRALTVPELSGPAGPVLLAAGDAGQLLRCEWGDGWSLTVTELIPGPRTRVTSWATDGHTLLIASGGRVLRRGEAGWQEEAVGLQADELVAGADGLVYALAMDHRLRLARRRPSGQWQPLDPLDQEPDQVGVDAAGQVVVATQRAVHRLVAGDWRPLEPPGGRVLWLGVAPAGDVYAEVASDGLGRVLLHHDGEIWRDISPPGFDVADVEFAVGRHFGRLCGLGRRDVSAGPLTQAHFLEYRDGTWHVGDPLPPVRPDRIVQETADGTLWATSVSGLFCHRGDGWQFVLDREPLRWSTDFLVIPGDGVHALAGGHIHQRPLPTR